MLLAQSGGEANCSNGTADASTASGSYKNHVPDGRLLTMVADKSKLRPRSLGSPALKNNKEHDHSPLPDVQRGTAPLQETNLPLKNTFFGLPSWRNWEELLRHVPFNPMTGQMPEINGLPEKIYPGIKGPTLEVALPQRRDMMDTRNHMSKSGMVRLIAWKLAKSGANDKDTMCLFLNTCNCAECINFGQTLYESAHFQ